MSELLKLINSHVRHDTLNDLTIIRSILEVYKESRDDELLENALKKIDGSAAFLKEMKEVESMVSEGTLKPLKLSDALKPIHNKYEGTKLNVRGDCVVMADDSLTSIFDNLVRNSITHGNADRVDIVITDKDEVCHVEISDNGEGIPQDLKEKVFEEGVSTSGTGLGLYIVKKTVERYGGSIHLKDSEQGTTFNLILNTPTTKKQESRDSGIEVLGDIGWGTHICHFYQTKEDLLRVLLPYFRAGLQNNEHCIWLTSEYTVEEAQKLVEDQLPHEVEVISHEEWYQKDVHQIIDGWVEKLNKSLAEGYDGLRVAADFRWLENIRKFTDYEEEAHKTIEDKKVIAICSHPISRYKTSEIADLTSRHHYTLFAREGDQELIENFKYKRTQNSLQEVEEKYRALVENANEAIMVIQDKKIMYANSKAMEISGYPKEELIYKPFDELIHPGDRELVTQYYNDRISGKKRFDSYQFRFKDKEGKTRWANLNAALIQWDGKPAILNFITDITAQKEAEEEREKHIHELETIKDTMAKASRMQDTNEICQLLADSVYSLNEDSYVVVSLYDRELDAITLRALAGFEDVSEEVNSVMERLRDLIISARGGASYTLQAGLKRYRKGCTVY